jgi:6-pyruvoyltetrahydropterin/6-carboxytetrahydropterin synthase
MIICKQFTFDAAHFLPNVHQYHKCRKLHGHTYHLTVFAEGPVLEPSGWIIDFDHLKEICMAVIERLDHTLLNEIPGLENPTAENVIKWLWVQLKPELHCLKKIELKETPTSGDL